VSKSHLTRTFRRFADTSIVDYRNELRLGEFLNQINTRPVLEAALGAGFGSYAQFHRVFRARFGKTPREYLSERRISAPFDGDPSAG
jgi:AraC-like DNA-binding protein